MIFFNCLVFSVGLIPFAAVSTEVDNSAEKSQLLEKTREKENPACKSDDSEVQQRLSEARKLLKSSRASDASAVLEAMLKDNPDNTEARMLLGHTYLKQKKYQHALNAFSSILLKNRKNPEACSGRALALVGLADVPKAIIWAKKAVELAPDDLHAWEILGQVYLTENYLDAPRAEAAYRQMLLLDGKNRKARLMLAKALSYQKKVDEAIVLLKQLVDESPNDTEAGIKLAESYYATRKLSKAEAVLKAILKSDKDNAKAKALLEAIASRRSYQFWVPVLVGIFVPLLYFLIRRMRKGRIVQG